jgi:hypothetical protein
MRLESNNAGRLDSQARHPASADLLRNGVATFSGDWVP